MKIKGIKKATAKGRAYYYHRTTGERILDEPGSAAFVLTVARLDKKTAPAPLHNLPGTWGHLVEEYKKSPNFTELKASTKKSYNDVFDYLHHLKNVELTDIDSADLLDLRDITYLEKGRGRTFSNYIATVMSVVFNYGKPRKLCKSNPAFRLEKIRRPKGKPKQNRAWSNEDIQHFLEKAPARIRIAVLLAVETGLRTADCLALKWNKYKQGRILIYQEKTGNEVWIPVSKSLAGNLDQLERSAVTIITNQFGRPYTKDGFKSSFRAAKLDLEQADLINRGLTFHGLRTTILTRIADMDGTARDIMAISGHRSEASVQIYIEEADRKKRAKKVIKRLEKRTK